MKTKFLSIFLGLLWTIPLLGQVQKQVYAIEGLKQLKTTDSKLTEDEKRMINFVCAKNGTIYVCSGCIHSKRDIRSVTRHKRLTI